MVAALAGRSSDILSIFFLATIILPGVCSVYEILTQLLSIPGKFYSHGIIRSIVSNETFWMAFTIARLCAMTEIAGQGVCFVGEGRPNPIVSFLTANRITQKSTEESVKICVNQWLIDR